MTLEIRGRNVFGWLRAERGVHRLVRISPFDGQKRRQTTFAMFEVIPEVEDAQEVQLNWDEIRVDTYRASGAGGQHVNKTESAVRLTHTPTNIVVSSQSQRSQMGAQDWLTHADGEVEAFIRAELERKATGAPLAAAGGDDE